MPPESPNPNADAFSEALGYEAAFYNLPDPVFVYNHSERRILLANRAAVARYGYSEAQFRSLGPWDIEAPYRAEELIRKIDALKAQGSAVYQTEHRAADGATFPAEIHTIYRDYDGTDIFIAICRELTDRLESERRLKEAETHYRAIFENSVCLICVADLRHGTFLDVNPAFEELLGYSREELLASPFVSFVHPEDLERTRQLVQAMLQSGERYVSFQNRYRCKDGRYLWLEWSSQPLPDSNLVYAVAHDITEQKWYERRLQQQNQMLRLHVEQTPLGVVEWSLDFHITAWNPAAERIFGYPQKEALGQPGAFLLADDSHREIQGAWDDLINKRGGQHSLNTNRHKDGSLLLCEWHNTSLVDENGEIVGVASLVHDVTEQERNRIELERAKEDAERANQAKSEFLSMMSHELRTPLNSIVGPCELLQLQLADESAAPLLEIMRTSSTHLLELINSILDLAKIESGSLEVELKEHPVDSFFAQRLLPLRESARRKGLDYVLENQLDAQATLRTDARLLLQILFNVVGNAIKFTKEGSIRIRLSSEGSRVHIEICDTGPGIPESVITHLFEPFRQGPEALSKAQRGSGLGLSITKKIVEQLGGTISATSEKDKGATFHITLPGLSQNVPHAPESKAGPASEPGEQPCQTKILLVEDEPSNQMVTGSLLKYLKYQYHLASSGEAALELWKKHRYPIVLMDVKLPGINGLEACRRIKEMAGEDRPAYLIAQSAFALDEQRRQFLEEGMDDYLSKPISIAALKETLEKAVAAIAD